MTYRERRERRIATLDRVATRLRGEAQGTFDEWAQYRGDMAFLTQPGHIPERARLIARTDRAVGKLNEADRRDEKAANIERQLAGAIYSDDVDAIEQLEKRIAKLEAKREAIKKHNREHRHGEGCTHPKTCDCWGSFARCRCRNHQLPAYVLSNLGADIRRNQQRLDGLRREKERPESIRPRYMLSRRRGDCSRCSDPIEREQPIYWHKPSHQAWHATHGPEVATVD